MYHMKHTCVNSMLYTDIKNYRGINGLVKKICKMIKQQLYGDVKYLLMSSVKQIILLQHFRPVPIHFFSQTRVLDTFLIHKRFHLHSQTAAYNHLTMGCCFHFMNQFRIVSSSHD